MRKILFHIAIVTIALLTQFCASEHDEMLIGTWKFANIEEKITNDDPPMAQEAVEYMKTNAKYVFNRNKTFVMDLGSGQNKNKGMWYVSENGTALNMRSEVDDSVGRATIRELSDEKLVLVIQIQPQHFQILTLYKAEDM